MEASTALSFIFIPGRSLSSFGQEHLLQKPLYQEELFWKVINVPMMYIFGKLREISFKWGGLIIFSSKNQLLIDKYLGNTHPLLALHIHKKYHDFDLWVAFSMYTGWSHLNLTTIRLPVHQNCQLLYALLISWSIYQRLWPWQRSNSWN